MSGPTTQVETGLLAAGYRLIGGMDEVGRGALAGPVSVGVVFITADTPDPPVGIKDSKLLTAQTRQELVEPVQKWAHAYGVGHASAQEIDHHGLSAALCLAGHRAIVQSGCNPDLVIVDGRHDWLTPRTLLDLPCTTPRVQTEVKGDQRLTIVAAASILAKTQRDKMMADHHLTYPHYGWDSNKGYAAPVHIQGIKDRGPCPLHRTSWNLPS